MPPWFLKNSGYLRQKGFRPFDYPKKMTTIPAILKPTDNRVVVAVSGLRLGTTTETETRTEFYCSPQQTTLALRWFSSSSLSLAEPTGNGVFFVIGPPLVETVSTSRVSLLANTGGRKRSTFPQSSRVRFRESVDSTIGMNETSP